MPSVLSILDVLEKYWKLNLGWGLRGKSSYKQKNISETLGHDSLKGPWESRKGIPGTLAVLSQSSPTPGGYRLIHGAQGKTGCVKMGCAKVLGQ